MVVVFTPLLDFVSGLVQGSEPVLVQTFISEFAIQTFHKLVSRGRGSYFESIPRHAEMNKTTVTSGGQIPNSLNRSSVSSSTFAAFTQGDSGALLCDC